MERRRVNWIGGHLAIVLATALAYFTPIVVGGALMEPHKTRHDPWSILIYGWIATLAPIVFTIYDEFRASRSRERYRWLLRRSRTIAPKLLLIPASMAAFAEAFSAPAQTDWGMNAIIAVALAIGPAAALGTKVLRWGIIRIGGVYGLPVDPVIGAVPLANGQFASVTTRGEIELVDAEKSNAPIADDDSVVAVVAATGNDIVLVLNTGVCIRHSGDRILQGQTTVSP